MDKTGSITEESPCAYCGRVSHVVRDEIPVCERCDSKAQRPHTQSEAIVKVAADLEIYK